MHDAHQEFFDKLASEWDLHFTAEDLERLTHIVDSFEIRKGMDILDLGCGTGVLFDLLRRRVSETGSVVGVDFSWQMASTAHRNFPFSNVNVVDADASVLPFTDRSFDIGIAFNAFPHFTNKPGVVRELERVLKPAARYYIIHLTSSDELARHHKEIGGTVARDKIPPEPEMRDMFKASRFNELIIEDHPGLYLATAINAG